MSTTDLLDAAGARFDDMTRALATPMPRSRALRVLGSAIAAAAFAGWKPPKARAEECDPPTTPCGQFCCPPGFTCHSDYPSQAPGLKGLCCHPRIAPVPCKESTAPGARGMCCPPKWTCCPNFIAASGTSHCCEPGKVCRGNRCVGSKCPRGTTRCGNKCCPQGNRCCQAEGKTTCCKKGADCCAPVSASCCKKGTYCCGFTSLKTTPKIRCCRRNKEGCCAVGPPDGGRELMCCSKPNECVKQIQPGQGGITPDSPTVCCPPKRIVPLSGRKICCPPGEVSMGGALVLPAGLCCREAQACGSGSSLTCCSPGQSCLNGQCVS